MCDKGEKWSENEGKNCLIVYIYFKLKYSTRINKLFTVRNFSHIYV